MTTRTESLSARHGLWSARVRAWADAAAVAIFTATFFSGPAWGQSAWPSYPNNTAISVTSTSNAGIGTASPVSKLGVGAVSGVGMTDSADGLVAGSENTLGSTANSMVIPVEFRYLGTNFNRLLVSGYRRVADSSWTGSGWRLQTAVDNSFTTYNTGRSYLELSNGYGLFLGTAGADRLTVTAAGYVGIGTTSPAALTHVYNGTTFSPSANVTSSILADGSYGGGVLLKDGTGYAGMWTTGGGTLLNIRAGGSSSGFGTAYGSMVLSSEGNVGIGTIAPAYKLSVNGTVQAKEVIVNTGWADHVFSPDYQLKPLQQVAAYVSEHRHLPDIPSAAEVKEKGVGLGEMQVKLLAKIEELTLHMIQLERRNRELEERFAGLEASARTATPTLGSASHN